ADLRRFSGERRRRRHGSVFDSLLDPLRDQSRRAGVVPFRGRRGAAPNLNHALSNGAYVRTLFLPARAARVRLAPGFHVWFAGACVMVVRVATVAFEGIDAKPVDVPVHLSGGSVVFGLVGLADKAVGESRERVRAALNASGLALPAKRITVNLAPADMPKEGSHY